MIIGFCSLAYLWEVRRYLHAFLVATDKRFVAAISSYCMYKRLACASCSLDAWAENCAVYTYSKIMSSKPNIAYLQCQECQPLACACSWEIDGVCLKSALTRLDLISWHRVACSACALRCHLSVPGMYARCAVQEAL